MSSCDMILFEDGRCEKPEVSLKTEDCEDPLRNIVSREEFEQLQGEHAKEVEGVTYEEYCETERECWNEMLKEQLKPLWEKSIPDSIIDKKAAKTEARRKSKSASFIPINKIEVI